MKGIWLDVKSGWRQLRSAPGTAAAAILTLAVGIGATVSVFSFVAAVLSAGAPLDDMERHVALWSHNRQESETKNPVSIADFVEWQRRATLVDSMVAMRRRAANLGGLESALRVTVHEVTPDYLAFFRLTPVLGRGFTESDAVPGAPLAVVLSHQFWRDSFASNPQVIGASIRLDGVPATVVGVLPRAPWLSGLFVPLETVSAAGDRSARNLFVFARMRGGVSMEQVRAEMIAIGERLEREAPRTHAGWTINTRPLQEEFVGPQARIAFGILLGTVVSVLLIGCVNVANLLLARGLARRSELAVRLALGAGRWRLARQLLVESGLIAFGGALASVAVSRWTLQFFVTQMPIDSPWVERATLNPRAIVLTLAAALVATLGSSLAPMLAARRQDPVSGLQAGGRSGIRANRRLTLGLVTAEIALAVLLLIVSGLLMRTLVELQNLDPGFEMSNVLTASVTLPQRTSPEDAVAWYSQALAEVRTLPGVLSAGATSRVPFAGSRFNPNRGLEIEGHPARSGDDGVWAVDYTVTPQYFESLRIQLVEGRTFTESDAATAPLVAVVSETMARRYWPDRSPLGSRLRTGNEPAGAWRTVVGVVSDVRNDDADQPPLPYLYLPLAQHPARTMTLVIKTAGDPLALAGALRRTIAAFDSDQALYDVRTMEDVAEADLRETRVLIQVLGAFALIAVGLAGLGVWGVSAQAVVQRTREIGVRVALGASARQVLALMIRQTLVPLVAGLGLGLAAGLGVARLIRSVLFQVSPTDPYTIAITLAILGSVAMVAVLGPAVRATRLDPAAALRL